tara:strand:+ start:599 stop:850 length:252 start_codon:yes stop_codon:yes gene_type:complete
LLIVLKETGSESIASRREEIQSFLKFVQINTVTADKNIPNHQTPQRRLVVIKIAKTAVVKIFNKIMEFLSSKQAPHLMSEECL